MDGLGAVVTFEPSGMVDGGFAVVGGDGGLVVVWFEQAAQTPINIAIDAFFIRNLPLDGYLTASCGDGSPFRISRQSQDNGWQGFGMAITELIRQTPH